MSMIEVALEAQAAGICVIPTRADGSKAPAIPWKPYQEQAPDAEQLRQWFAIDGYQGMGVVCGAVSGGLEMVELEGAFASEHGMERLSRAIAAAGLSDVWRRVRSGPSESTPRGGLHFYWRCSTIDGNLKLARRVDDGGAIEVLIETRGEGGYSVIAPSNGTTHPSGRPWERLPDAGGWDQLAVITLPERDALLAACRSFDAMPSPPIHLGTTPPPTTPQRQLPSDHWTETAPQTLQRLGWTYSHSSADDRRGGTAEHWVRPGKDPRHGHSATVWADGRTTIWSTSVETSPDVDDHRRLSTWQLHVELEFGGDHRAAAAEIVRALPAETRTTLAAPVPQPSGEGQDDGYEPEWGLVDLTNWVDGSHTAPTPDVLRLPNGVGMLYRAQLNWIHGDSGSGKTWLALAAAAELLRAGEHVAWLHWEDPTPATIVGRLQALGISRTMILEQFHYWDPAGAGLQRQIQAVVDAIADINPAMAFIDSAGEALNADALNEDRDNEVGPWITQGARRIVDAGYGVTVIDHATKAKDNPLFPSGSKRKRAAVTGIGLMVTSTQPPTVDSDGVIDVRCAKDRHGAWRQGDVIGYVDFRHVQGSLCIDLRESTGVRIGSDAPPTPEEMHERRVREVVHLVERHPDGLTANQLKTLMSSASSERKLEAISEARERGLVGVTAGANRALIHRPAGGPMEGILI